MILRNTSNNRGAAGFKTWDFTYDALGHMTKKVFQKNTSAETFVHFYQYDPVNQNLWKIYTNTVDNPAGEKLQATYVYYLHGPLKRVELATNLQGIDYTYTLQGALKAINNGNRSADPGGDGTANGFSQDQFGEVLEYFNGDYNNGRATAQPVNGVNTTPLADSYAGNIKSMTWFSEKPSGLGLTDNAITYVYDYDPKYQMIGSTWGTGINFVANPAGYSATTFNQETIKDPVAGTPGYDANGNITYLQRTNGSGTLTDKFAYTYSGTNNQL